MSKSTMAKAPSGSERSVAWQRRDGQRLGVVMMTSRQRVILNQVHSRSPAYLLGLRRGMQFMSINDTPLTSAKQAEKMLKNMPSGRLLLGLCKPVHSTRSVNSWTTVKWAVAWMLTNRRVSFNNCMALIAFDVFAGTSAPLFKQYLFGTAMPRYLGTTSAESIESCLIDLISVLVIFGGTQLLHIQTTYWFEVERLDGSGFSPAMKRALTVHMTALPQRTLDQCHEVELLNIIEGDIAALDKVIGVFFSTVGAMCTLVLCVTRDQTKVHRA